jgi:hypothetical protein
VALEKSDSSKSVGSGFLAGGGAALVSSLVVYLVVPNQREVSASRGLDVRLPVVAASGDGISFSLSGTF